MKMRVLTALMHFNFFYMLILVLALPKLNAGIKNQYRIAYFYMA